MTTKQTAHYETIQAKTVLNAVKAPSMPFDWSINPYRGCRHGCSFCYARSTHAFLGLDADDTFQNRILVKSNAAEALAAQLKRLSRTRGDALRRSHVAIGTATDPYQPAEAEAKLTRACLELLAEYRVPTSVTTRSPLVLRDLDVLRKVNLVSINISLSTLDNGVWRHFEPMAPPPARRLETLQGVTDAGLRAGVFIAPLLPYISDAPEDVRSVLEQASLRGASFAMISFLRLRTPEVKAWFTASLRRHYPQLAGKYESLFGRSGGTPRYYREPREAAYRAFRTEFGLNGDVPDRPVRLAGERAEASAADPFGGDPCGVPAPEQLSFSF